MGELSIKQYTTVYKYSNEGICFFRIIRKDKLKFKLYDLNMKCSELLGFSKKDLLSKKKDIFIKGGQDAVADQWKMHIKRAAEGNEECFEWQFIKKDNSILYTEINMQSIEIQEDNFLIVFIYDVTKFHKNQELIISQRQELYNLIESSPDFIISYDLEGRTSFLNGKLMKELKLNSVSEVIGKKPSETWPDRRFDMIEQSAAQVVKSGTDMTIEFQGTDADGEPFYRDIHICPKKDIAGNIIGTIAFGRDTTERKRNERKLLILTSAINRLSDSVLLMDEKFHFIYANDSACKNLGYTPEEFAAMTPLDIDPDLDLDSFKEMTEVHSESKHFQDFERRHRARDGRTYPVEVSVCRIVFDGAQYDLTLSRDISERKRLQYEIEQRERQFRTLAEGSPDTVLRYDRQGHVIYANPAMLQYFNLSLEELIGRLPSDIWPDGRYSAVEEALSRVLSGSSEQETVYLTELYVEGSVYGQVIIVPEYNKKNEITGAIAIGRDLSQLYKVEMALRKSEREFRSLAESTPDSIARYTLDGRILYINPSIEKILGIKLGDVEGKRHSDFLPKIFRKYESQLLEVGRTGNPGETDLILNDKNSNIKYYHIRFVAERGDADEIISVLAIGHDITQRKQMEDSLKEHERRLKDMAYHDALTGLPNRILFADRMNQGIAHAKRSGELLIIVYLDLDRFKPVNDEYGHYTGDWVLIETSKRIVSTLRAGDTVARIGGDEFVLLLANNSNTFEVQGVLERLMETICEPLEYRNKKIKLSASMGISVYPVDGVDSDLLLRYADQAMLLAKRSGRNRFMYFNPKFS